MRVLFHDFAGHPFAAQLARALAARGHAVLHLHSAANPTPKGALAPRADDPAGLAFDSLARGRGYARYDFLGRWLDERAYGRELARRIRAERPEAVLFANTPLDVLAVAVPAARAVGARVVLWVQDLLGVAAARILSKRLPVVGAAIGCWHVALERRLVRGADAAVVITEDFVPILERFGVEAARVSVVPNWGPLGEIEPRAHANAWARAHGLGARPVFLYTGMMGLKHDPALVLALAERMGGRAQVVVVSEGMGADWLGARAPANLTILPFQPYARMGEVLAAGDVMVAVLEAEAGVFSVPSKVLSYLCAGRPVLGSIPPENLAARILAQAGAGLVARPGDRASFLDLAERLAGDADLRRRLGEAGHAYACAHFAIGPIAERFERVLAP